MVDEYGQTSSVAPRPASVSVIDPISPAIDRVRDVLFQPFDLGRWFVIGFCAWLAQLGTGGGNGGGGKRQVDSPGDVRHMIDQARDYFHANANWLLPVIVAGAMLVIVLVLLFIWLSSRGRFMFLHCVAQNKAEVGVPWRQYERHAYSLFLFRIALTLMGFLIFGLLAVLGIALTVSAGALDLRSAPIFGIVMLGSVFFVVGVTFGVVGVFTKDFVAPVMYLHTTRCTQAWRILLTLLSANKGRFVLYILFRAVMAIAIGVCLVVLTVATCGCACCFFGLPYVGTVFLLPLHVFTRSYSLYYLAQYGPEFYVFAPELEPIMPTDEAWR